ncbi:MAG: hypothetical protein WA633_21305 [Stellaceae bacterium]
MELDAFAQEEREGFAVLGDLPAMRQIGNDRLAAVAGVVPDQVVEHATHGAECGDRACLVNVEMRRAHQNPVAQHTAVFRVGLRRLELKLGAVELVGNVGGVAKAHLQPIESRDGGGTALQKAAAGPPRAHETRVAHTVFSPTSAKRISSRLVRPHRIHSNDT